MASLSGGSAARALPKTGGTPIGGGAGSFDVQGAAQTALSAYTGGGKPVTETRQLWAPPEYQRPTEFGFSDKLVRSMRDQAERRIRADTEDRLSQAREQAIRLGAENTGVYQEEMNRINEEAIRAETEAITQINIAAEQAAREERMHERQIQTRYETTAPRFETTTYTPSSPLGSGGRLMGGPISSPGRAEEAEAAKIAGERFREKFEDWEFNRNMQDLLRGR
jgi:hypothetical protein